MKLPAALPYFGILHVFAALAAASGATAGEAEEVATAPLEPLSPDDSFEQQPAARSLRGNIIWGAEADDFRTALTPPRPPTAAPDDSETAGGGVAKEKDIWAEEAGDFIWEEEAGDFRGELTSPPTAAPDLRDLPEGAVPLEGGTSTTSITYTSLKDTSLKTSVYEGRVVTNEPKGKKDPKNPAKRIGDVTVTCTSTCNGGGTVSGCDANWSGCSSCSCSGFSGSCTCTKISVYTESK